jgi:hypothetical protein
MSEMRSEIEVAVYDGETLVQRCACTPRDLPDGRPGVIWRGVLYPLYPGDRIEVGSTGEEEKRHSFAVLPGDGATWVLIRGLAGELTEAKARLEAKGIRVSRTGRWLGDAVGDVAFDWFLRFEDSLSADEVGELLGSRPIDSYAAEVRLIVVEQQLVEMKAALARLAEQLSNATRAPAVPIRPNPSAANERDLVLETALEKIRELEAQINAVPARIIPSRPATIRLQEELAGVLKALRPDIILIRDSMQVAVGEFHSRGAFYRLLQELPSAGGRPDGWKALRGAERWWERHISTGQDDSGRAYARFDAESRKWEVLLGWKGEQQRDIEWLKRRI